MKNVRTRSSQTKGSLVTTDKDVQLTSAGSLRDHPSFFFFYRYVNPRVNKFRKTQNLEEQPILTDPQQDHRSVS